MTLALIDDSAVELASRRVSLGIQAVAIGKTALSGRGYRCSCAAGSHVLTALPVPA
jgi:hypothetical protein